MKTPVNRHPPQPIPSTSDHATSTSPTTPSRYGSSHRPHSDHQKHVREAESSVKHHEPSLYPLSYAPSVLSLDVLDHINLMQSRKNVTWLDFGDSPPMRCLDLGCGTGAWILDAAKRWPKTYFVGYDIAKIQPSHNLMPLMVSERVCWLNGNFLTEKLPFDDNFFDHVHISSIAWGVPESAWDGLFEEIARVLRPGGVVEVAEEDILFPTLPGSYTLKTKQARSRPIPNKMNNIISISPLNKPIPIPHAHALIESLFFGVFETRMINLRPTSIIPHHLNIHFRKVTSTSPLEYPFPPPPLSRLKLHDAAFQNYSSKSNSKSGSGTGAGAGSSDHRFQSDSYSHESHSSISSLDSSSLDLDSPSSPVRRRRPERQQPPSQYSHHPSSSSLHHTTRSQPPQAQTTTATTTMSSLSPPSSPLLQQQFLQQQQQQQQRLLERERERERRSSPPPPSLFTHSPASSISAKGGGGTTGTTAAAVAPTATPTSHTLTFGSFKPTSGIHLLPPVTAEINSRNLALQLNTAYQRIVACKETMWGELQRRLALRRAGGENLLYNLGWDEEAEDIIVESNESLENNNNHGHHNNNNGGSGNGNGGNATILREIQERTLFDNFLLRFERDMRYRTSLTDSIELSLNWKRPPPAPMSKHERRRAIELENAIIEAAKAEAKVGVDICGYTQITRSCKSFIGFKEVKKS